MKIQRYQLILLTALMYFIACKKDVSTEIQSTSILSTSNNSLAKTDGIITIQTGILPPVTPQSFIPNGSSSFAEFQITSAKHILIYQLFFSASSFIHSININNLGSQPNAGGTITFDGSGPVVNAGGGISLKTQVFYKLVDSLTSGKTAQLKLTHIVYRTDDEKYHDFYPESAGAAKTMCLVNNVPEMSFQDPEPDTLPNGFKQIAVLKLTSDTGWVLNDLPLKLTSLYTGYIPKSKMIIKSAGKTIAKSDSMQLNEGDTAETVIHFDSGFQHVAGKAETIKIYAPVKGFYHVIITSMEPASKFSWKDNFGTFLSGTQNDKYFKSATGQSNSH